MTVSKESISCPFCSIMYIAYSESFPPENNAASFMPTVHLCAAGLKTMHLSMSEQIR